MSLRPLFLISLAICCVGHAIADPVELYEYAGVLEVEVPYETILRGEIMHVKMRVENRGNDPIPIVKDGLNDIVQLAWIPWKNGEAIQRPGRLPGMGSYKKLPTETFSDNNLTIYNTEELLPGSAYEAGHVNIGSITSSIPSGASEIQIRPALYGGGGKVIYGSLFTINVIPKTSKAFKKVFETKFIVGGSSPYQFEIYEVPINGEIYLFNNTGVRFCRIPPGIGYSLSFKQEALERFATVDFDDPTLDPLIFSWRKYNLVSASRETVPWLFDKPEEDAPGKGAGRKTPVTKGADAGPVGQDARPADGGEPPTAATWWPWIGAAAVLFAGALWAIRRRVA